MTKIMVVEDNENNLYLIDFILRKKGYEVTKTSSGEESIELALKEKPALILMDIQLPGIDGLEAVRRIRESEADGNIPILALTSYAMTGDREKALKAGCNGYIEKPIDPEKFLREVEAYL
jgi:two-component system cell cycle response regulator DivK